MTLARAANYAQIHFFFDRVQIYVARLTQVLEDGLKEYAYVINYEVRLSPGGFRKRGESQYRDEFYCSWFEVLRCKVFLSINKPLGAVTRSFRGPEVQASQHTPMRASDPEPTPECQKLPLPMRQSDQG